MVGGCLERHRNRLYKLPSTFRNPIREQHTSSSLSLSLCCRSLPQVSLRLECLFANLEDKELIAASGISGVDSTVFHQPSYRQPTAYLANIR